MANDVQLRRRCATEQVREAFAGLDALDPKTADDLHRARHGLKLALMQTRDYAPSERRRIALILQRVTAEYSAPLRRNKMKIAAILDYIQDKEKIKVTLPAHCFYRQGFLEDGRLRAAGPFDDDSGALWTLEVETIEEAEKIVSGDPFVAAGVCVSWKLRPLGPVVVSPVKMPISK